MTTLWHNGRSADGSDAAALAFAGFAHFTAMQVRGGAVRGLDLHLARLREASARLYGRDLDGTTVRRLVRQALGGVGDASVSVIVHPPEGEFAPAGTDRPPLHISVRVGPEAAGPAGPMSLLPVEHVRFMPSIKHVGESAKTFYLWQAQAAGYDDAVFVDRTGRLSEATIWNLACFDGHTVSWPVADVLAGTTAQILQRQLTRAGVPQRSEPLTAGDLAARGLATVVMNSWTPGVAVDRLGEHTLPDAADFVGLLHEVFGTERPEAI